MSKDVFEKLHVIVVDDEQFMRRLMSALLRELGIGHVDRFKGAEEALEMISTASPPVDLVILDLDMPGMNGIDFIRHVRQGGEVKISPDLPIIVLTGHADEEKVKVAVSLGIGGYLLKPVSRDKIENRIISTLGLAGKS